MIQTINEVPGNVAAFRASGTVTSDDFEQVVIPEVDRLVQKTDELNFLLVLDTAAGNFTAGAWMQDAFLGLKNLGNWHRAAIVTDSDAIINITNSFSYLVPGEFMGFKTEMLDAAVRWVSETDSEG